VELISGGLDSNFFLPDVAATVISKNLKPTHQDHEPPTMPFSGTASRLLQG